MTNISKLRRENNISLLNSIITDSSDINTKIALKEIENELTERKYGLVWEVYKEKVELELQNSIPIFTEMQNKEIINDKDNSNFNFLLEGDNLQSLSLLEKSLKESVDIVTIDPPYNTKNKDFSFNDELIGKEDLFRHSKWLSFMNKRLLKIYNLMSKKGIIFINIDNNEVAPLKMLCDEIFGEENFISILHWKRKKQPSYLHGQVASIMEYILVYAKNRNNIDKLSLSTPTDSNTRIDNASNVKSERLIKAGIRVKLPSDISLIKKGVYKAKTMQTEYLDDVHIVNGRTTNDFRAIAQYRDSQERIDLFCDEDVFFITKNYGFRRDKLQAERNKKKAITDLILDWGDNQDSDLEIKSLFSKKVFSYPKPTLLIKNLIKSTGYKDAIVLDCFAGTGTSGQAVLELNKEDGGSRRFILCTNNENNICEEITYKRLQKVIYGYNCNVKKEETLFEKDLKLKDITNTDNISKIMDKIQKIKDKQKNNYSSFSVKFEKGILTLVGYIEKDNTVKGIPSNLKYYKLDKDKFILKTEDNIAEKLQKHIKEMVQLQYGISIDGNTYRLIFTDEEVEKLESSPDLLSGCKAIYVSSQVLFSSSQKKLLENIAIYTIPDYYFEKELREVGELW